MTRETKSVQRLFVDQPLAADKTLTLTGNPAHYLRNVLRANADDAVLVFNGRDGEWQAHITAIDKRAVTLVTARRTRPQTPKADQADIWLLVAPVKRARLDYLAQKATEMGVTRLVPVITRRTQGGTVNLDRLRANAQEAAEQCGILQLPEITDPARLDDALQDWDGARRLLFCDETAEAGMGVSELAAQLRPPLAVLIGPEGGFTPEEKQELLALNQTVRISLGPRILRTDTAVVAALALVQWLAGDWQGGSTDAR
ncbi:MAG: 16S rRNA (uracil(1498)-N(3))-methyltransferase [Parvibaculales bacterium]